VAAHLAKFPPHPLPLPPGITAAELPGLLKPVLGPSGRPLRDDWRLEENIPSPRPPVLLESISKRNADNFTSASYTNCDSLAEREAPCSWPDNGGASTMLPAARANSSLRICGTNTSTDPVEGCCSETITDDCIELDSGVECAVESHRGLGCRPQPQQIGPEPACSKNCDDNSGAPATLPGANNCTCSENITDGCNEQEFASSTEDLKLVIQVSTQDHTKERDEEYLSTRTNLHNSSETSRVDGNRSGSTRSRTSSCSKGGGSSGSSSGAADVPTPCRMIAKLNSDAPCFFPLLRACSIRKSGEAEALVYLWEKKTDEEIVREVRGILDDFDTLRMECDEIFFACNKDKTNQTIPSEKLYHITQRLIDSLGCRDEAVLERIADAFEDVAQDSQDHIEIVQFRGYVACVLTEILNELRARTSSSRELEHGTRDKIKENQTTPHLQREAQGERRTSNPTDVQQIVACGDTEGSRPSEEPEEPSLLGMLRGVFENMAGTVSGLTAESETLEDFGLNTSDTLLPSIS